MISKNDCKIQLLFISIFVLLNVVIFSFSVSKYNYYSGKYQSATFWNASDGQRYWGVALNLAEKKSFTVKNVNQEPIKRAIQATYSHEKLNENPLKRAGPIPALLFSIPIKLVGLDRAGVWIVTMQCILLYVSGVGARRLGRSFQAKGNVIQGLIIFNPSLINLSHHAQSDIVFMFLLTIFLVLVGKILEEPDQPRYRNFVGIGVVAGLLPLARPLGFYLILVAPMLIMIVFVLSGMWSQVRWKQLLVGLSMSSLLACVVMAPWAVRNYQVMNHFGLTHSEQIMMKWHYRAFERNRMSKHIDIDVQEYLRGYRTEKQCKLEDECKMAVIQAYVHAVWDSGISNISGALLVSWGKLFFSGGVTQLTKYLGFSTIDLGNFLAADRTWAEEIARLFVFIRGNYAPFFNLLLVGVVFTTICRVLGLIGLVKIITTRKTMVHTIFNLGTMAMFLSMYLFSGISRFRAPLESILALFGAIGISWVLSYRRSSKDSLIKAENSH